MQKAYGLIRDLHAELVGVSMDGTSEAAMMAKMVGASYKLLSDPDGAVAEAYGVYNLLGDGLAVPSVFIIGSKGNIEWSYVGESVMDRPSTDEILALLRMH